MQSQNINDPVECSICHIRGDRFGQRMKWMRCGKEKKASDEKKMHWLADSNSSCLYKRKDERGKEKGKNKKEKKKTTREKKKEDEE